MRAKLETAAGGIVLIYNGIVALLMVVAIVVAIVAGKWWLIPVGAVILGPAFYADRGRKLRAERRAALLRRIEPLLDYPPLVNMDDRQRKELGEALSSEFATFERLPQKWQSAILEAEKNRPPTRSPPRT